MRINRLQINVATGRFTLPVVILVCLLLWILSLGSYRELFTLLVFALTGYMIIETNIAFTLIRTRTTLTVCIFWLLTSIMSFLHPFEWHNLSALAFILSVFHLFKSYESAHPARYIYHCFLFLSAGSIVFPQLLFFTPIFYAGSVVFCTLNSKSFWAGILGIFTPYWILFCYAFIFERMDLFYLPLQELVQFQSIDYSCIPLFSLISWGVATTLQLVSHIHYFQISYQDKTRTRIFLLFLIYAGFFTTLFMLVQPHHLSALLPIQTVCTAFLTGHLFTLTRNKFSGIFFIVTFVGIILLTGYHLWMQFFNF